MKQKDRNFMEVYCLEALGYLKKSNDSLKVKHCGICNMYGHVSQECHKFLMKN